MNARAEQKYIVCNADEGDSGTFSDRMILEGDPFVLIEGMVIAGLAVGATEGYIYLRSEYPHAWVILLAAIQKAQDAGYLGSNILGSGRRFELHVRRGAGAYICGEETAMLESLEGKRGMVRPKPPIPALSGLWGRPTLIHNVMTLAAVPVIVDKGGAFTPFSVRVDPGARSLSNWRATSNGADWSRRPSASHCARCSMISAEVPPPGGPFVRFRWVVLWELICPSRSSIPRWITRPFPPQVAWLGTAASSSLTTRSTWPRWPAMPWSFAPSNLAGNALHAASEALAAWK